MPAFQGPLAAAAAVTLTPMVATAAALAMLDVGWRHGYCFVLFCFLLIDLFHSFGRKKEVRRKKRRKEEGRKEGRKE
jgi:hypothetical protein